MIINVKTFDYWVDGFWIAQTQVNPVIDAFAGRIPFLLIQVYLYAKFIGYDGSIICVDDWVKRKCLLSFLNTTRRTITKSYGKNEDDNEDMQEDMRKLREDVAKNMTVKRDARCCHVLHTDKQVIE